ncbi:MAG: pyrimidine 5'-nucleotidase [Azospirillaceae bacterium]
MDVWIFDLDNTLYPASSNLFPQVSARMAAFIAETFALPHDEARALQKRYFREYGTTMRGLMSNHAVDPHAFLAYVHDIDVSVLPAATALDRALDRLDGRKLVYTNGSADHAARVLDRLGVARHFEACFDIVAAEFDPKPDRGAYRRMLARHGIEPTRAVMVEDMAVNLEPAHELGMTTVLVRGDGGETVADGPGADESADAPAHVHHVTDDLPSWLATIADALPRR